MKFNLLPFLREPTKLLLAIFPLQCIFRGLLDNSLQTRRLAHLARVVRSPSPSENAALAISFSIGVQISQSLKLFFSCLVNFFVEFFKAYILLIGGFDVHNEILFDGVDLRGCGMWLWWEFSGLEVRV
jgi:hypothetical protein